MLFSDQSSLPQTLYTGNQRMPDSTYMAVNGYNPDGTKNAWGQINSFIPLGGIASNLQAQVGAQGTDAEQNVKNDMPQRIQKLLTEATIAATVATGGAGAPLIGGTAAVGDAVGGGMATALGDTGAIAGEDAVGGGIASGLADSGATGTMSALSGGDGMSALGKQALDMVKNYSTNMKIPQQNNKPNSRTSVVTNDNSI